MSDTHHEEAHTGPIKTPNQVLWASLLSLVLPIFIIIGLVYFVNVDGKPNAGVCNKEEEASAKAKLIDSSVVDLCQAKKDLAAAERLKPVGVIEVMDANRPLRAGEEVYKAQCAACHAAGLAGAPAYSNAAAWGPRIKTGYDALLNSALKGKGAMGAQGGGEYLDAEIGRAVVYMANAAGAKFAEPQQAAPAANSPAEVAAAK